MKWVVVAAITAVGLFAWSLSRLSADAVGMAIGMILGTLGASTPVLLTLLLRREDPAPVTYIIATAPLTDSGCIGVNTPERPLSASVEAPVSLCEVNR